MPNDVAILGGMRGIDVRKQPFMKDLGTGTTKRQQKVIYLYCTSSSITTGDVVAIDETSTTYGRGYGCKKFVTAADDPALCIGLANETLAAAGWLEVLLAGPHTAANTVTGAAAGDTLVPSTAADGRLMIANAVDEPILAAALAAESGNLCHVWVKDQGHFP